MEHVTNLLESVPIPRFVRMRQTFERPVLDAPVKQMYDRIAASPFYQNVRPGMRIAVAVGSRGIANLPDFVRCIVSLLREKGADPFLIPAMGSHGGATAEGQKSMLIGLGVTEAYVGCKICATMEVDQLGVTPAHHLPVYLDHFANEADGIVILNRIKPHVAFRGPYESGLMKMITIGLGKQKGAEACHNLGFGHMAEHIPEIAAETIRRKNILFAVGVVENAYHETCCVCVLGKDEISREEPALQAYAKTLAPRLLFDKLDVCVVDELGKNISGTGSDTGVVGRYHTPYISGGPQITKIGILDLTEESHGNANGIGIVDFTTRRLFEKFRMDQTYPNALTSTVPLSVKIPMVLDNDREVFQAAIKTCNIVDHSKATVVRFRNTIALDVLEVSESLLPAAREIRGLEQISDAYELSFDAEGNLSPLE